MEAENTEQELKSVLRRIDLFADLNDDELVSIIGWSEVLHADRSHSLFARGDSGDALFIVLGGSVVISRSDSEERTTDIAEYISGEYFGDIDLFSSGRRSASARLSDHSSVVRFPAEGLALHDVLEEIPSLSARLLHRFITVVAGRIRETNSLISQNTPWVQELRRQVYGDKLTGLFNQAYLSEELPRLLAEENAPVASIMIKPDNFKKLNDTYGHDAGDAILRRIAATVRGWAGENPAIRYRGNEMVVLVPQCDVAGARRMADDVREKLMHLDISNVVSGVSSLDMPFSVGVAIYPDHAGTGEDLITRSSEVLFEARDCGGNRTAVSGDQGLASTVLPETRS